MKHDNHPEIVELRSRIEELLTEKTDIHTRAADKKLDDVQQARWDDIVTEIDEARAQLKATEERLDRLDRVTESRARWGSLQVGSGPDEHYAANDVARMGSSEISTRARRILDSARHLASHQGDHLLRMLEGEGSRNVDRDYIARLTVLTESPEYRSAFQRVMTDPHPVLTGAEAEALRAVQEFRAMSIGTDTSGGYGVPVLIDPTIVLTAQQAANPFLAISRVETITTDAWKGVSSDGVTWSWDAEAAEVSDDTPTLAQPVIPVHTARGFVPFSIEVGSDYPGFAENISRLLSEGYGDLTAHAFAIGSGSGQPTGIFTALDANTNVEVVVTTDGAFGAVDISKVWTALPDRAKANATWAMSEDVKEEIRTFDGDEYASRTVTLTEAEFRIRERPVAASGYAPAFTGVTTAANILVVGDFRNYLIAQRAGMALELVPHLFGTTNNRPTGQRGYFAWARVGADSINDNAFRLLQNQ